MKTLCTGSATLLLLLASNVLAQEGMITVRVTSESGSPITNAVVHAGFATAIKPGWGWGAGKPNRVEGVTDTNGVCELQGEGNGGAVGVAAFNEGYYGSSGYLVLFTNLTGRKWQPWNPTIEVLLKLIGKPIPMYVRSVRETTVPTNGVPIGFDLMVGDWVRPFGEGVTADFLFTMDQEPERVAQSNRGREKKLFDLTLTVSFANDGDGIQAVTVPRGEGRSALRLDREAPFDRYESGVVRRVYRDSPDQPPQSDIREDQNYFFRVRTKRDDAGKIVSAHYGKIHGDFHFEHLGKVTFTYYLNPTSNDRNMEFDPSKNLFTNLNSLEEVREP